MNRFIAAIAISAVAITASMPMARAAEPVMAPQKHAASQVANPHITKVQATPTVAPTKAKKAKKQHVKKIQGQQATKTSATAPAVTR